MLVYSSPLTKAKAFSGGAPQPVLAWAEIVQQGNEWIARAGDRIATLSRCKFTHGLDIHRELGTQIYMKTLYEDLNVLFFYS